MDERTYRKQRPVYSGVLKYFPDALLDVANVSFVGNEQHNPGTPLHWDRSKSTDELDALTRHLIGAGTRDSDGTRHSAKVAWRALANLQKEIEAEKAQPEQAQTKGPTPRRNSMEGPTTGAANPSDTALYASCGGGEFRCPQDGELGCCPEAPHTRAECAWIAARNREGR
jgi:hypothetical protein